MSEILYREVAQVVLIFGSETWLLLAKIERKVEGTHAFFLRQISWKQS